MVTVSDFTFPSSNGNNTIRCRQWLPEGDIRAAVQLVHGVAEHIERYGEYASFLAEHGIAVVGDDHLGHGRSIADETELGWLGEKKGWEHMVRDEKRLHDLLLDRFPGVPLVLFGHSMGSFIARTYMGWYPEDHGLYVISGTGHTPPAVCAFGRFLSGAEIRLRGSKYRSALLQSIAFGGYLKRVEHPIGPHDWICRDETVVRRYGADPLCGFTATAGLMHDMMDGLSLICRRDHMKKMRRDAPVLFIAGGDDPVGSYGKGVEKVAGMFRSVGMSDVTVLLYPGYRHEILNELDKEKVWDDTLHWIEDKI